MLIPWENSKKGKYVEELSSLKLDEKSPQLENN